MAREGDAPNFACDEVGRAGGTWVFGLGLVRGWCGDLGCAGTVNPGIIHEDFRKILSFL